MSPGFKIDHSEVFLNIHSVLYPCLFDAVQLFSITEVYNKRWLNAVEAKK